MKYLIPVFIIFSSIHLSAKGIEFFKGTWAEALELAKAEEKVIFVDAYAEWCGPCKRMARNVFTDAEVGDFYNDNFINLKIDMEKPKNRDFSQKYPAAAFPTLYFIDFTGEVVEKIKGAQTVEQFINLGKSVVSKNDRSAYYAEAYEAGDRSPELMYNYVKSLNKVDKPSIKIANDYLNSQEDLTTPKNLKFLLEATTEADSRIFDLLIQHRAAVEQIQPKEAVERRIERAINATLKKAIEFESDDLLKEAQAKMKKHVPENITFQLESEMKFAQKMQEGDRYLKAWKTYIKKMTDSDEERGLMAKALLDSFPSYQKGKLEAEKVAQKAADNGNTARLKLIYAQILYANNKIEASKKAASQAMYLAKQSGNRMEMAQVNRFLKILQ